MAHPCEFVTGGTNRPPIHILHFDGHGIFGDGRQEAQAEPHTLQGGLQGMLAFETEEGTLDLVTAEQLAQTLLDSGVQLAVLTACQSAMSDASDAFSSVAARLIRAGIKAVSAMSASVLVVSAARYTEAFYKELAKGSPASLAQERARQSLHTNPRRQTVSRVRTEEGAPVKLQDWWLPHLYQQVPLLLQPKGKKKRTTNKQTLEAIRPPLNSAMPPTPRYGFTGRSRELLQIERELGHNKLVVIHGFGGMGKTALAREAADWLTRTDMYQEACFVSFENGQASARSLLSQLGFFLGVYDGTYTPDNPKKALTQLQPALKRQHILLIADNLESILPGGEAPLEVEERTELWNVLLDLQRLGAGVLLTTRTTTFGDGRLAEGAHVTYLPLDGLSRDDAYQLASTLLASLRIDRHRAPYQLLREVLSQLGHHPLSIQLVLPVLRTHELTQIQQDFAALLQQFTDDTETGRNRSLQASLEYSLQRLSEEQRELLSRLTVFEGGALEDSLLAITEIPKAIWAELRPALEQAALLTEEHLAGVLVPFLHFHPVLIPFLRGQSEATDEALQERYMVRYYLTSRYYHTEDDRHPLQIRAMVQRELPNLRSALSSLLSILEAGEQVAEWHLEVALDMMSNVSRFLEYFGYSREQIQLQQHLSQIMKIQRPPAEGTLTQMAYLYEQTLGDQELQKGQTQTAITRFTNLLVRIEAQQEGTYGPGSYGQAETLARLGYCLRKDGNLPSAEHSFRKAISVSEALLKQDPKNDGFLALQARLLDDLGNVLLSQGKHSEAKAAYKQALELCEQRGDLRGQAIVQAQLAEISIEREVMAVKQEEYTEVQIRYQGVLETIRVLGEPQVEANMRYRLGEIAQRQQRWSEAERYYRESLALSELSEDPKGAVLALSGLGRVAADTDRFEEAKEWYQHALDLSGKSDVTSAEYASCLSNLAASLALEVVAEHVQGTSAQSAQLTQAQDYVKQAVVIEERLRDPHLWRSYKLLAEIANWEENIEMEHDYRRREREAYATVAGHRYEVDQWGSQLIPALAAAQDDLEVREQVEESMQAAGKKIEPLTKALHRLWEGERDWHQLSEGLENRDALLILRVLETLTSLQGAETTTNARSAEQIFSTLPASIREALTDGDEEAFHQAFDELSAQEQQDVMEFLTVPGYCRGYHQKGT